MNKLERWLENLKDSGLRQALRFILSEQNPEKRIDNIHYLMIQIEEFARMYPDYEGGKE